MCYIVNYVAVTQTIYEQQNVMYDILMFVYSNMLIHAYAHATCDIIHMHSFYINLPSIAVTIILFDTVYNLHIA